MKIEVNVSKKHLLFFAGLVFVFGAVFVYATTPNPGHDASTLGSGSSATTYGGSSTFAGSASDIFFFPGRLSTGANANPSADSGGPRNLYVKDASPWSGAGIESSGLDASFGSHTYLDFIHDSRVKSNLDYYVAPAGGRGQLLVNSQVNANETVVTVFTKDSVYIRGRDLSSPGATQTSGNAPTVVFQEENSPSFWAVIKRGSQYTGVPGEKDALIVSYYDGSAWNERLVINKTATCIGGRCLRLGPPGCNGIITDRPTCVTLGVESCTGGGCTSAYLNCAGTGSAGTAPVLCPTVPI